MKNRKIKICGTFLLMALLLGILATAVSASGDSYSWYCVHRKDHKQPSVPELAFIEEYGGYYVDRVHGDASTEKVIYLTFDAGYENGNVAKVLDVLKEEDVPGAFFVLGNLIDKEPALIERMFNEGHLVCNHTYSHPPMVGKTQAEFDAELMRLEQKCLEKTGKSLAKFYRPPEGRFDRSSLQYACERGYKTVFWSFAYADWDNRSQPSPEYAIKKILDNTHNGEIMLLHPTSNTNATVLGQVIQELKRQGFRFGSLDELQ